MFTLAFGAVLATFGIGVAVVLPVFGILHDREAHQKKATAAEIRSLNEQLADQAIAIDAYREMVTVERAIAYAN